MPDHPQFDVVFTAEVVRSKLRIGAFYALNFGTYYLPIAAIPPRLEGVSALKVDGSDHRSGSGPFAYGKDVPTAISRLRDQVLKSKDEETWRVLVQFALDVNDASELTLSTDKRGRS